MKVLKIWFIVKVIGLGAAGLLVVFLYVLFSAGKKADETEDKINRIIKEGDKP